MNPSQAVTISPRIHAVRFDTVTVLIDYATGQVNTLSGTAHETWTALAATGCTQQAADRCRLGETPVQQITAYLIDQGLLVPVEQPRPWPLQQVPPSPGGSWGTVETPARLAPITHVPPLWIIRAVIALSTILTVRQAGTPRRRFARLLALIHTTERIQRAASFTEARSAVRAVRLLARVVPARIACLEESTAATLALALAGRHAEWCHGVATDPVRLHAWLQVDGVPVEEPDSTHRYAPIPLIIER